MQHVETSPEPETVIVQCAMPRPTFTALERLAAVLGLAVDGTIVLMVRRGCERYRIPLDDAA